MPLVTCWWSLFRKIWLSNNTKPSLFPEGQKNISGLTKERSDRERHLSKHRDTWIRKACYWGSKWGSKWVDWTDGINPATWLIYMTQIHDSDPDSTILRLKGLTSQWGEEIQDWMFHCTCARINTHQPNQNIFCAKTANLFIIVSTPRVFARGLSNIIALGGSPLPPPVPGGGFALIGASLTHLHGAYRKSICPLSS